MTMLEASLVTYNNLRNDREPHRAMREGAHIGTCGPNHRNWFATGHPVGPERDPNHHAPGCWAPVP
jgi:hypothetical protein